MSRPRSHLRRVGPVACWSLVVVVASVVSPPGSGPAEATPTALPTLLGVGVDKWVHLGAYATTAFLGADALRARDTASVALAAVAATALGGGVELVQASIPARSFSVADAVANAVGAALGAGAYSAFGGVEGVLGSEAGDD
ncbi:VanZ family protein [Halogeometricum limi]|uniref:VanZ like family protein n=1 Tax=Halogeometricum limi TaxID=555875 RepID=A0A1I6G032_9EURY|nr:VanZ family protein [Halogeometricum limi]SFR35555.1 VanZ like family protein [Halogeometricum limi]